MNEIAKAKLQEWEIRLTAAQTGHYIACERYRRFHNVIGIPLVCFSTFVSAFIFFSSPNFYISAGLKLAGIIVAILAAIQTFIRPSEMSELHRIKATKYGALKRRIEVFTCMSESESNFPQFVAELMNEWNALSEDSPITPNPIRNKIKEIIEHDFHKNVGQ